MVLKIFFILFNIFILALFNSGCDTSSTSPAISASHTPTISTITQKDRLDEMVTKADLIAYGTINAQRYEDVNVGQGDSAGKQTYIIYTFSIDKVIKGDPTTKEVYIKELANMFDGNSWYFRVSDIALVCLQKENNNIYTLSPPYILNGPSAVLWIKGVSVISPTKLEDVIGRVILIMKANNIPIALPASEIPPLPAPITTRPTK